MDRVIKVFTKDGLNTILLNSRRIFTADVINTFLLNSTRILTGPISLILIPYFLTAKMQGYWYSFISISALSILADLGFTLIITQFAAHEFSKLSLSREGNIIGSQTEYYKIASLFRFVISWGGKTVIIAFPIISIIGYYILSSEDVTFPWIYPWVIFTVGSGIKFFCNLLLAFFEGCSEISKVQKLRYKNTLSYFFINCLLLSLNFGLYALAFTNLITALLLSHDSWKTFKVPAKQLFTDRIVKYSWNVELLNLLWKYAISWASGYLIFQLFTPLAFKSFGSIYAGKVGFTITLITSIFSIANIWIYVINPKLNMHVAKKEWSQLDSLFRKNLLLSLATFILIAIFFLGIYTQASRYYPKIVERFLDLGNLSMLLFVWLIQLLINSLAVYSRAHKEEPFVIPSLAIGIYIALTTVLASTFLADRFLFLGFYSSFFLSLPWFSLVYLRRKKQLHL